MAEPLRIPPERLYWNQRQAHVERIQAMRRAYENDGARLPEATERNRELRYELRRWKAACVVLAGLVAFLAVGVVALAVGC